MSHAPASRLTVEKLLRPLLFIPLLLLFPSCEDGTGVRMSTVQIQLTDKPTDAIESAHVWISRVYLQGCGTEDEEAQGEAAECLPVDLFNDPDNPWDYDLLLLRDGITEELTDPVEVETGIYRQLRIKVDSAVVVLAEGYSFKDGSNEAVLKVAGGGVLKVKLEEPINAEEGQLTVILVDFDVEKNFVLQGGGPNHDVFQGVLFTPTLVELGRTKAGK